MSMTTELMSEVEVTDQARRAAEQAACRARVTVRDTLALGDIAEVAGLFDETWSTGSDASVLPANLVRALAHAGSCLMGAYADGDLVGAVFGFVGMRGKPHLHSHMLAVCSGVQRGGIGFALKQYQRAWALAHGLELVHWTFDPLVRRNAHFNLCKLGAEIVAYHEHFYGQMIDNVNAGDESDRVEIRWSVRSERAIAASEGRGIEPDVEALLARGAQVVLGKEADGSPRAVDATGPLLLFRLPSDIVALRRTDPALAMEWRKALRDSMGGAIHDGCAVTGISRTGWYVLEKRPQA
ncbi:MAG: GNAT family N-acetyltransferase [Actinomycetota bacterium]